jgi:predicted nuclease of restriction endonuclease-like (RecB) superfamily
MEIIPNNSNKNYEGLLSRISETYKQGFQRAVAAVNTNMVTTYWKIGQYIVEFEQGGQVKAEYGKELLTRLSKDLTFVHGKGFSLSNVYQMRQFFIRYPIFQTVSGKSERLTWSHFCELIPIDNQIEREFYEIQCQNENWNVRELKRQKKSSLFLRLAVSKDKEGILQLAKNGQILQKPADIIREPCILEFLKIPEPYQFNETDLETRLINHLQEFLLELGKGFAFVGRQYRITLGNTHYYVDLVFYHRILKCFVLIDLKKEKAGYQDVGQMNMYLGYFENEENTEGDNPPIGIVLAKEKDDLLVKYAMHNISSQLFINKYQLYLPDKEELRREIEKQLKIEKE